MEQSVKSLFALYVSRSDLRPASLDIKARACRYFCRWFGRPVADSPGGIAEYDLPVAEVTAPMAADYRTMLGRSRTRVSVNSYLNNFRAFWSWLHRQGYVPLDPFVFIGPLRIEEGPPRETFTAPELGRIMAVAEPLEKIQVMLGLLGCRRGEMQSIQVGQVRLEASEPHIVQQGKGNSAGTLAYGTKGHQARYVALPAAMAFDGRIEPLRRLVAERIEQLGGDPEAYLCVDVRHIARRLGRERAWSDLRDLEGNAPRRFRRLQERAGIRPPRRYHELRAAFTTSMLDAGLDLARVAQLVGHHDVNQTRRYDRKERLSLVAEAAKIAASTYVSNVS
jgi:integrase